MAGSLLDYLSFFFDKKDLREDFLLKTNKKNSEKIRKYKNCTNKN